MSKEEEGESTDALGLEEGDADNKLLTKPLLDKHAGNETQSCPLVCKSLRAQIKAHPKRIACLFLAAALLFYVTIVGISLCWKPNATLGI